MKKYWMVHRQDGSNPQRKHESYLDACGEAKRLAQENPGSKFAILEAIEYTICELPKPIFHKTETLTAEIASTTPSHYDNKLRGKHPENIVFDQPEIFIVEDVENLNAVDTYIRVKPSLPGGMKSSGSGNWASLRAGDCLVKYTDKSIIRYWVRETPTSSTIKISCGGEIKKGDRLTLVMNAANRKEEDAG